MGLKLDFLDGEDCKEAERIMLSIDATYLRLWPRSQSEIFDTANSIFAKLFATCISWARISMVSIL